MAMSVRTAAAILVSIAVAGCGSSGRAQSAGPQPNVYVTEREARDDFFQCITAKAPALDDTLSDARTVARSAAQSCSGVGERLFSAMTANATDAQRRAMRQTWPQHTTDLAAQIVLAQRAKRR